MKTNRILATLVLIIFLVTTYGADLAFGAEMPIQPAPGGLAITALYPNVEKPIGYSSSDGGASGFYADIGWAGVDNPQGVSITGKYVNVYLQESPKGYRTAKPVFIKEKDVPAGTTPIRMKNLNSGTVYTANAKAYYEYTDALTNNTYKSDESASSNTVKFLTDIDVQCETTGTNKFKITWDDVWNDGKRISYKLYVSENADFTNTLPIHITKDEIGINGPVFVNEADGTLTYEHTVNDAGRVYYVKIIPDISDSEIVRTKEPTTVLVSTYILAKTTKMAVTDAGTIWKLDWSPVVTGISSSDIKVSYQIDKYIGNVPIPMLVEESTTTFITVPLGEDISYYLIRATVTKDGQNLYPDSVNIVSDKITLQDEKVSSTPAMPEIVQEFKDSAGNVIITYSDILNSDNSVKTKGELGTDTAAVLWRVPKNADGTIDKDVLYDIWLIEDPNKIDKPATDTLIQSSFTPGEVNYVVDTADNNKVIGYKYKLEGLTANHTYYFKIVAKKFFAEKVEDVIQNVEHASAPALKVIITLSGGAIDTPLIPSDPPLQIRKKTDGVSNMITDKSVTIQLKNRWYEIFDSIKGEWSYDDQKSRADKVSLNDTPPYNPVTTPPDNITYRKVAYDKGITLSVGCQEYYEGIDITTIDSYILEGISTAANDEREDPTLNAPENIPSQTTAAIYAKHNVVIPVSNLKPNTTYILWVRAVREGEPDLLSDVSNPIIFTTLPSSSQIVEKPVVPSFNYTYASDTFIDLGWELTDGNTYYVKYGTVDDPEKAGAAITVTAEQIKSSGVDYIRIPGLKPDTLYYFWIQAEAFSKDLTESKKSEWSDSLPLKTLKDIPPTTPRGFGTKEKTKNSITFEWIKEDNLEYILEVAGGVDYKDVKQYKVGAVSEYKVDGLKSNFRYFARLYAYDPAKALTSQPTQSISVRTLRSSDDYDSDQDVDNVITGDFIDKATKVVSGTWIVKIVGVNADRLVEVMNTDNKLDYTVDVSEPPSKADYISVYVSKKVFDKLEQLKENLSFKTSTVTYDLKAGIFANVVSADTQAEQIYIFNITLSPDKPAAKANDLLLRKQLAEIEVTLDTGDSVVEISDFNTPLVVNYPYSVQTDYADGKTAGYIFNPKTRDWEKQNSWNRYDVDNISGVISFSSQTSGVFAVADKTSSIFDDIYGHKYEDSIINVAYIHKLKSVSGRLFEPDEKAALGDAVKLIFDTLDYQYGSEYMESAAKAGLVKGNKYSGAVCTRQEAAWMATVLYELKSGTKVRAEYDTASDYSDYNRIDKDLLNKVTFAVENGFVPNSSSGRLDPTGAVTRGELMYMIEKALVLAGEI
ncbi:hypothetical protein LY28_00741 [Ruminiclostridium sufflavum DSM 19573]|uniref:Fibronectin type-III domain-containing protein n=1 Tax=Ruminiclostridium sufflavum DSM 19573 TaxID=1121337 RepID=A0A318XNE2_9FIRM|nr:fibronectin type III domain-containing protein [Ruminiclostridium sufflavum]PYG89522.1 hypothetical protein LY28_00741 [Ruminiclostridium sufflavum DSM 19573]